MPAFRRIVVPVDFSECSEHALDLAVDLARESEAELTLVHVVEVPAYAYPEPSVSFADLLTPLADLAQEKLDQLVTRVRGRWPPTRGLLKLGVPWEQALSAAAQVGADLVVIGTHGRRGVAHALMGSVAERVVRASPVPVLTVRGRAAA
jgi:nucleotide-binding universal stress UspA family protein